MAFPKKRCYRLGDHAGQQVHGRVRRANELSTPRCGHGCDSITQQVAVSNKDVIKDPLNPSKQHGFSKFDLRWPITRYFWPFSELRSVFLAKKPIDIRSDASKQTPSQHKRLPLRSPQTSTNIFQKHDPQKPHTQKKQPPQTTASCQKKAPRKESSYISKTSPLGHLSSAPSTNHLLHPKPLQPSPRKCENPYNPAPTESKNLSDPSKKSKNPTVTPHPNNSPQKSLKPYPNPSLPNRSAQFIQATRGVERPGLSAAGRRRGGPRGRCPGLASPSVVLALGGDGRSETGKRTGWNG